MKRSKIFIVCLGLTLFIFMNVPSVFAQIPFDGLWWQGKVSFKGNRLTPEPSNMLSDTGNGSAKVWFYSRYLAGPDRYEFFTCGQSPYDKTDYGIGSSTLNFTDIYFNGQLTQLWNLDNGTGWDIETTLGLPFTALPYNINTFPVLLVKGKSLTQATLSSTSCTAYVVDASKESFYWILGSCTLKAKSIDPSKVSSKVPQPCLDDLP